MSTPEYRYGTTKYTSLHTQLRRKRGSSSQFSCVDCGAKAEEWSLPHNENQFDFAIYVPRCRSCHRKYDCNTEEARANYRENAQKLWESGVLTKEALSKRSLGNKFAQRYVVSDEIKEEIATLYLSGGHTVASLCEQFSLTKSVVWTITKAAKDKAAQ